MGKQRNILSHSKSKNGIAEVKKGFLPMMHLCEIINKSVCLKKSPVVVYDTKIVPAVPEKITFKQNVLQMKVDVGKKTFL